MYIQQTFELSLVLDTDKFQQVLNDNYGTTERLDDDESIDRSLAPKGITITYRDSTYKKKITLFIKPEWVLDDDEPDPDKLIRKLEKRVDDYFDHRYRLRDFKISGLSLVSDIDVQDRDRVASYVKVLQRIGRVKGFTPTRESWINDDLCFSLDGNSNGIDFAIFDLEGLLRKQLSQAESGRKQLKSMIEKSKGLLRAEVQLTEPRAIRSYTDSTDTDDQMAALIENREKVFLDTFMRIVPFGDFLKKDKATEIIRAKVSDDRLRRRMLRLLDLIPEKRSLLPALKALNHRNVEEIIRAFNDIELSPVCISKRSKVKKLDNIYKFM